MGHPHLSVGKSFLFIHKHTVNYGVVMVSRNLERANENDGFKMTALECAIKIKIKIALTRLLNRQTVELNVDFNCSRSMELQ